MPGASNILRRSCLRCFFPAVASAHCSAAVSTPAALSEHPLALTVSSYGAEWAPASAKHSPRHTPRKRLKISDEHRHEGATPQTNVGLCRMRLLGNSGLRRLERTGKASHTEGRAGCAAKVGRKTSSGRGSVVSRFDKRSRFLRLFASSPSANMRFSACARWCDLASKRPRCSADCARMHLVRRLKQIYRR